MPEFVVVATTEAHEARVVEYYETDSVEERVVYNIEAESAAEAERVVHRIEQGLTLAPIGCREVSRVETERALVNESYNGAEFLNREPQSTTIVEIEEVFNSSDNTELTNEASLDWEV